MNIMNFFTPKSNVAYLLNTYTVRQAIEKLENCRYSAIPILDKENHYVGTITDGDILMYIKEKGFNTIKESEKFSVMDIPRMRDNIPVTINTPMDMVLITALDHNFVPVIDDRGFFIGIVTRKSIISNFIYGEIKVELKDVEKVSEH